MPPLTVDADGWFTVVGETQPVESPPSRVVEKKKDAYGGLGLEDERPCSRPSTGPDRKKDVPAARSPSGWIIAVNDVHLDGETPLSGEKRVDDSEGLAVTANAKLSLNESEDRKESAVTAEVSCGEIATTTGDDKEVEESAPGPSTGKKALDGSEPVSSPSPSSKPSDVSGGGMTTDVAAQTESSLPSPVEKPLDDASTASSSSTASSDADSKESITSNESSIGWSSGSKPAEKSSDATPAIKESTDTASITSTPSTSASGSSVVASTSSSTNDTPKRLRPRARSSPQPIPTLGLDPKLLVGKVLTHIRRSPDHPTVTLSFADGTTYQILVDGYNPRNTPGNKAANLDASSSSRTCVLEMDEVLLRMLEVPGRHVVDRAITDCAHIRLADKAYERREWEHSWQQTHVAVAFKFAEEPRWHCVWAMRAEYDERGCIFRAFDDVYLQVLERQLPRTPGKKKSDSARHAPSPLKSPGKEQSSPLKAAPRPPPSPTAVRSLRAPPSPLRTRTGNGQLTSHKPASSPPPLKSPGKEQSSPLKAAPGPPPSPTAVKSSRAPPSPLRTRTGNGQPTMHKPASSPPPSPTATRSSKSGPKTPKKHTLRKNKSWRKETQT